MISHKVRSITVCTSASFYRQSWKIKERLEKQGFRVSMPHTAKVMRRTGNYQVSHYKVWYKDKNLFKRKALLMARHFREIEKGDAILVLNLNKKGSRGYIGGNVLMEMALAFYLKKLIYIWRTVQESQPFYEEILGMEPIFLNEKVE